MLLLACFAAHVLSKCSVRPQSEIFEKVLPKRRSNGEIMSVCVLVCVSVCLFAGVVVVAVVSVALLWLLLLCVVCPFSLSLPVPHHNNPTQLPS